MQNTQPVICTAPPATVQAAENPVPTVRPNLYNFAPAEQWGCKKDAEKQGDMMPEPSNRQTETAGIHKAIWHTVMKTKRGGGGGGDVVNPPKP